ncbi:MAG: 2-hydroxyacyl-CoA dehydratase [Bacteroidota bacterium]|nr:2-hydroxyacyl-CoA dehydratase [Bacteroidota bacterium]MDP4233226.1 2-hydroxyacyl-CoA dehydratase [Bacteroidota bacterium]MDP4242155.1 2-hydroxyacyl-CoA dehydratase [Bacteroidota bacterium]MDP4287805.1 2-hydroxyacyl-CoA dehydratase [Bacteroidota bacterium]
MHRTFEKLISECEHIAFDLQFSHAKAWKRASSERFLAGYLPIYIPREVIHAMGGLPVGIMGTGDRMQIIKGDAYYQSYICHLPRGVVELAMSGAFAEFDAFIFPSICDVIRNLSGMFQIFKPDVFVKYLDLPQNFLPSVGGAYYRREIETTVEGILSHRSTVPFENEVWVERLNHSIRLYNENRALIERIVTIRQEYPWRVSAVDWYNVLRSGLAMPVEEHNNILYELEAYLQDDRGRPLDNIRVVISGAFCEQPPVGLIKTIELAGCYIVDDDFMLGSRWIEGDIAEDTSDPLGAIVDAYLQHSTFSASLYEAAPASGTKVERLASLVKSRKADGVIFAAPSFCDPALLDRPELQLGLERAGVRTIGFQYSENTGQFKVIKEEVGAFSDSIKLWGSGADGSEPDSHMWLPTVIEDLTAIA